MRLIFQRARLWLVTPGLGLGCGRFRDAEEGSSLIELAFLLSFFAVPLLVGTAEVGRLVYESIEVANAAYVGASYGGQNTTFAQDTSGIVTAAQTEASDIGTGLSVTPSVFYVCPSSVGGTRYTGTNAQSNATAACGRALEFVSVSVTGTIPALFKYPTLPSSFSVSSSSVQEVVQ